MAPGARNSIYFVTDDLDRSRRLIDIFGWKFPVEAMSLYSTEVTGDTGSGLCIFDTDLSDHGNIPSIKERISRSFQSRDKYFVIEDDNHSLKVQANSLGARGVIRKSKLKSDAGALLQRLRKELMLDTWHGIAEGPRQTLTGLSSLNDDLYDAVARGEPLPREKVDECSDRLISGLKHQPVSSWLQAVREHHSYTYRHCMLVSGLAVTFAQALGMRRADVERLAVGALMHDVGKMRLPLGLLDKPGALTPEERELINKHPQFGAEILKADGQFSGEVIEIALNHHEYLDGTGYPNGLTAERISDPVRILTVVDIFSALIDERSYKAAMPCEQAYEVLLGMESKLDMDIVRVFGLTAANAPSKADWLLTNAGTA